jgi:hypothetical protein
MKTRICSTCKIEKSIEEFVKNKYKNGGFSWYCKLCKSVIDKEYYKTHIERRKQISLRRQKIKINNKKLIQEYLKTHCCIKCGIQDIRVLDFHHKDPNKKEHCISKMLLIKQQRLLEEINKCEILCANCHRIEHCPHSEMDIT